MYTYIVKANKIPENSSRVMLTKSLQQGNYDALSVEENNYIQEQQKNKITSFHFNHLSDHVFMEEIKEKDQHGHFLEAIRLVADRLTSCIQNNKLTEVYISAPDFSEEEILAFAEGMVLSNYRFVVYKTDKESHIRTLDTLHVFHDDLQQSSVDELNILMEATLNARTLVNLPANYLTAHDLAEEIEKFALDVDAKVEIFNKTKIEALKMGGLIAVNKGSVNPPTFSIFEYSPKNAINEKPIIFVGKGVVYDTGGLNIKTGDFMNTMKCDMGGAAAAAAAAFAIAKAKLPLHVIALIPATDNRPGGNAYASGDVITMFDGQTVEVINTDAEGRMILADALAYAKKFDPMLVIDLATLTGAAARAIGNLGVVAMGNRSEEYMKQLKFSGEKTSERIVEFPFWDEYAEQLKSEIADMVHLGGAEGGAITAGKFLEKFTAYPYIHLDIAGPAFTTKKLNYRGIGGTGVGVRLLFDFAKRIATS